MRELVLVFAIAGCFLPGMAWSQPEVGSVSGSLLQGETVVLFGSGFGVKSPAAPYIYDNFEGGAVGEVISGGWYVTSNVANHRPQYSNTIVRKAGSQSALQDFSDGTYNSTLGLTGLSVGKLYMSGWFYNTTSGSPSRNFKMLSLRGGGPGDWVTPNGRFDVYPTSGSGHQYIADCEIGIPANNWNTGGDLHSNEWNRLECWMDHGTPGVSNGQWDIILNGGSWGSNSSVSGEFMATTNCPYTNFYISSYFAVDVGTPAPEMDMYWDELYIDTTQARIEIGDNISWAASNHKEIQVPTQWSDNTVSFMVNVGTFNGGDQIYVFVVGENGIPSEFGIPVVVGGDSVMEGPGIPGRPQLVPEDG